MNRQINFRTRSYVAGQAMDKEPLRVSPRLEGLASRHRSNGGTGNPEPIGSYPKFTAESVRQRQEATSKEQKTQEEQEAKTW